MMHTTIYSSHTKRTALFCCRMCFDLARAHRDPGWFRAATRTALFCCRILLGPPWAHRDPGWFRAATRKERPCFAAECAPTPLGTHEHSRVHFLIPVLAVYVLGLRNIICRSILQVQAFEVLRNTCTQTSTYL